MVLLLLWMEWWGIAKLTRHVFLVFVMSPQNVRTGAERVCGVRTETSVSSAAALRRDGTRYAKRFTNSWHFLVCFYCIYCFWNVRDQTGCGVFTVLHWMAVSEALWAHYGCINGQCLILSMRLLQRNLAVTDLVLKALFASKKMLMFFSSVCWANPFYVCAFSIRLSNMCNMEKGKCNVGSFFSQNRYNRCWHAFVGTTQFQITISNVLHLICICLITEYCN